MFFARYKMEGILDKYADIAVFDTEQERNEWVNFEDSFTKETGMETKEDHEFDRIPVSEEEAIKLIDFDKLISDTYDPAIKWFPRSNRFKVYRGF